MKIRITMLMLPALLCIAVTLRAQAPACCTKPPAMSDMLALARTEAFARAHEAPEPFQYTAKRGTDISFQTLDGKKGHAYYVPASQAVERTLIIFHEWWGLNDYIRREADRLQDSLGPVDVYALDLFDGSVATTAEEAQRLSSGVDHRRTDVLIKGLLVKIGPDAQVSTWGWCMGASYAFRAAVMADKQAYGCVMFYGFPEKNVDNISPLKTDVLYVRATQDKFISEEDVSRFGKAVEAAGRKFTLIRVNADHAFANPSNPHYDAQRAAETTHEALSFIRRYLQL
jgi:carboxymethylenebutenolidase